MPINAAFHPTRSNLTQAQKDFESSALTGATVAENQFVPQVIDINNPPRQNYRHQEFPKVVYRKPGTKLVRNEDEATVPVKGRMLSVPEDPNECSQVVNDQKALDAALKKGFALKPFVDEAKAE